jgi:dihydroneopterin aldolase
MDLVNVRELRVPTVIGHHAWERDIEQTLLVDLDVCAPITAAATSDALADAIDYDALATEVTAWIRHRQAKLIETLAEGVAQHLIATFGIPWLRITIWKPGAVAAAARVGVTIERGVRPA